MNWKFLVVFLGSFLTAQTHLSDLKLKGKVKSLESTTYLASNASKTTSSGFLDSEMFDAVKMNFDPKGNLILRENYLDYRGKLGLFDRTIYQFNYSNQIEKQETTLVQNGEEPKKISQRQKFYYIGNQLVRRDEFNSGRTSDQFWVINHFYAGGRLVKKEFWMDDEIFSTSVFENQLQKVLSETTYHNDGKTGQILSFQYDGNNNLKMKTTQSGSQISTETFDYKGINLSEKTTKNAQGIVEMRETFGANQLPVSLEKINYKNGLLTKFKFEFQFDIENNWINCLILEDEIPKYSIKRTINYY